MGHSYFWLMCLHTIFVPMQGFFNFLVYIYPRMNMTGSFGQKVSQKFSITKSRFGLSSTRKSKSGKNFSMTATAISATEKAQNNISNSERDSEKRVLEKRVTFMEEEEKAEEVDVEELVATTTSISLIKGTFDDTQTCTDDVI